MRVPSEGVKPISHPVFARVYARLSPGAESRGVGEHRSRLLEGLSGRVLELGAGNGLNLSHYPRSTLEVVALEPEPYLRARTIQAAARAPVAVTVVDGVAEAIPFPDRSFDAAVASLVLCSVADPMVALRELARVLKPGAELRYYEHVVSLREGSARLQRLLDATVWPRLAGGCHMARDTGALLREAGFAVRSEERLAVKTSWAQPAIPHVLGAASRP